MLSDLSYSNIFLPKSQVISQLPNPSTKVSFPFSNWKGGHWGSNNFFLSPMNTMQFQGTQINESGTGTGSRCSDILTPNQYSTPSGFTAHLTTAAQVPTPRGSPPLYLARASPSHAVTHAICILSATYIGLHA
jgi:hypothetical protein